MSTDIEFGKKDAADAAREQFSDHLCSDDDRRLKTVTFSSDTPEGALEQIRFRADESRSVADRRSQTAEISPSEREKIKDAGGFKGPATIFSWESAKGVFQREGQMNFWSDAIPSVADFEDPIEGAEAWIQKSRENADGFGSIRNEGEEDIKQRRREERAAKAAQGGQCDHAQGHCEHGDKEACEFLRSACGYSEGEVEQLLGMADRRDESGGGEQQALVSMEYQGEEIEVTPEQAGALHRSWQGYKAGVSELADALDAARSAVINARQAFHVINSIRGNHGQDDLHPDRLHDLLDALDAMPGDIPEVRTLDHFAEQGESEPEPDTGSETEVKRLPDTVGDYTKKRGLNPGGAGDGPGTAVFTGNGEVVRVHPVRTGNGWWATLNDDVGTPTAKGSRLVRSKMGGVEFDAAAEAALGYMRDESEPEPEAVIEENPQRNLGGADPQRRLAGGEQGERGQGEVEETTEENPGGIMADRRAEEPDAPTEENTTVDIPEAFQTAEGGQETL